MGVQLSECIDIKWSHSGGRWEDHLINGVGDRIVRLTGGSEGMLSSTILKDRIEGHKQRIVTQDHRRGCSQKFTKPDRVTQPNNDETRNRQVLIMCT